MVKNVRGAIIFIMTGLLMLSMGCKTKPVKNQAEPQSNVSSTVDFIYNFQGMDDVSINKDIIYKSDGDISLKLDVYRMLDKSNDNAPTVVLIHGVGPDNNMKDSDIFKTWGRKIACSGFNTVTFNWRSSAPSTDVTDLIKFIRNNADILKINGDSICIFAFSGGVFEGIRDAMEANTGYIKSVVAYYGFIDDSILKINTSIKLPPFFIAMGALDENFNPSINDDFISRAQAAGCNTVKIIHSNAGHAFDVFNPEDNETKLIIDKTLKFIEENK